MAHPNTKTLLFERLCRSRLASLLALSLVFMLSMSPLAQAATYTVTNTNDAGAGSIRQAIIDANANGDDIIDGDAAVDGTVNLLSDLPAITENVVIDMSGTTSFAIDGTGETQCLQFNGWEFRQHKPSERFNLENCGQGINITGATTGLTIGDTGAGQEVTIQNTTGMGIDVTGGDNVTIQNTTIDNAGGPGIKIRNTADNITIGGDTADERVTVINSANDGIDVESSDGTTIQGSYIGTSDGTSDDGNGNNGILVLNGVTNLQIGGDTAGEGNVISGNTQNGINITGSDSVTVEGNIIGLTAAGTAALGNDGSGVYIESESNTIGGSTASAGNIISGNGDDGIRIDGNINPANNNTIKFNYIGTNITGDAALANTESGIDISGGNITGTVIGGDLEGNVISGNTGDGISIFGTASTGTTIYGNTIGLATDQNAALGNGGDGIDVQGDSTLIGSSAGDGYRNYIGSNGQWGVNINGADSVLVHNNYIGVAADGTTERPNTSGGYKLKPPANRMKLVETPLQKETASIQELV